jgi:hypothetical protein
MKPNQLGPLIAAVVSSNHEGQSEADILDLVFTVNDAIVTYSALLTMFYYEPELRDKFERSRALFISSRAGGESPNLTTMI